MLICALLLWAYLDFYGVGVESAHVNIVRQFIYFVGGALIFHYQPVFHQMNQSAKKLAVAVCILLDAVSFLLFPRLNEDFIMLIAFPLGSACKYLTLAFCQKHARCAGLAVLVMRSIWYTV